MIPKRFLSLLLAGALVCSLAACQKQGDGVSQAVRVPAPDILRAVTVGAHNAPDYPGAAEMTAEELAAKADEIVAFAADASMNAILYKATPYGEAAWPSKALPRTPAFQFSAGFFSPTLDPFEILIERAAAKNIAVYAVVSPYEAGKPSAKPQKGSIARTNPEAVVSSAGSPAYRPDNPLVHAQAVAAAEELCRRYALTGVLLGDADGSAVSDYANFYTYLTALAADMKETVAAASDGKAQFGILLDGEHRADAQRDAFIDEICRLGASFLLPILPQSAEGGSDSPYAEELGRLLALAEPYGVPLYAGLPADSGAASCRAALLVNNALALYGGALDGYAALKAESADVLDAAIPLLHTQRPILPDYTLDIPSEFRITQPLDGKRLTVDTSWDAYYVGGTSDPGKDVFFEGEPLENHTASGLFGKLMDLEYGLNTFDFMQDGEILTAEVYRPRPNEAKPAKISAISTYVASPTTSVFQPYAQQAVNGDLPLLLQCNAPAGGKVTARLDGEEYELEQTTRAEDGTPVTFRREVRIPAPDPDAVTSAGFVTYVLAYGGKTSEAEAPGEVFLVGENCTPAFRVDSDVAFVLQLTDGQLLNGNFATYLKNGAVGAIAGQTANYFITPYGGYVPKHVTSIAAKLQSPENDISSAEYLPAGEKGEEKLVLRGTLRPSYVVEDSAGGNFTIRLFDTRGLPEGGIQADSDFFSAIRAARDGSETVLSFKAGNERYFGYNVSFEGNDTVLTFKRRPQLSSVRGRPLAGLTVVLDPGHGAQDVGSLGLPGETGPMEKNANLYTALIMRPLLEGLGATVYMTRESDEDFLELDQRVGFTEAHDADLFFSVHHNSLERNYDPNKARGAEVHWFNDVSEGLALSCLDAVAGATGRAARKTEQSHYVFLLNTICPSVLLELGFMPNQTEYEQILDPATALAVAQAVCDAAVAFVGGL